MSSTPRAKPKASGRSQRLQRRRPRPEVAALTEWAACDSQVDALIARNQEAELKNNAATVIQSRVRSRRRRRAKLFVNGGRGGSGRATPVDDVGVGVGSSVDASPVMDRPPALTDRNTFAELPPNPNLQTDAMGRMARLCFGNFLDEVVSDFATVTGTDGRNNASMLELAQPTWWSRAARGDCASRKRRHEPVSQRPAPPSARARQGAVRPSVSHLQTASPLRPLWETR